MNQEILEETIAKEMSNLLKKIGIWSISAIIGLTILSGFFFGYVHKLENQNLAIVQSFSGNIEVRRAAGWWFQAFPTIVQYPKAGMYRLNAQDHDSLEIQFNNKSKALVNYREAEDFAVSSPFLL